MTHILFSIVISVFAGIIGWLLLDLLVRQRKISDGQLVELELRRHQTAVEFDDAMLMRTLRSLPGENEAFQALPEQEQTSWILNSLFGQYRKWLILRKRDETPLNEQQQIFEFKEEVKTDE